MFINRFFSKLSKPRETVKSSPIYPTQYKQNGNDSIITSEGLYDFTNFSKHEVNTINEVLDTVATRYPKKYRAIGLAMETYGVVYKPRYILFEIIILKYQNSIKAIDQLAVGIAYVNKGANYRASAIKYLENSIYKISKTDISYVSNVYPLWWVYNTLAELYEQEYNYDLALKYANLTVQKKNAIYPYDITRKGRIYKKIDINICIDYYENILKDKRAEPYKQQVLKELQEAKTLAAKNYVYKARKRKPKDSDLSLDEQINNAALWFLSNQRY